MFKPTTTEFGKQPDNETDNSDKISALQNQMDTVLQNQSKILAILNQFTNSYISSGPQYFPIKDIIQLRLMDAEIASDKNKYVSIGYKYI